MKRVKKKTPDETTSNDISQPAVYKTVSLDEVLIDWAWNARLDANAWVPTDTETHETALVESILSRGLDTPPIVRVNPFDTTKTRHPYLLVAGFRRMAALIAIRERGALIPNEPDFTPEAPRVRMQVRECAESEARSINVRENSARAAVNPADAAYGVNEWFLQCKREGRKVTHEMAATEFGYSTSHVCKLQQIMRDVDEEIADEWRRAPVQLGVTDMVKLAGAPKERQREAYTALVAAKAKGTATHKLRIENGFVCIDREETTPYDAAERRVRRFASTLGKLVFEDFDSMNPNWTPHLATLLGGKLSDFSKADVRKLSAACSEAYENEINDVAKPSEE